VFLSSIFLSDNLPLTQTPQRISRRVIAEQHLALTDTFNASWFSPGAKLSESEFIGEVFLKCYAKDVVERVAHTVRTILQRAYGPDVALPHIHIDGHLDANFPYILSHLEYIIGELLRNSIQAVAERHQRQRAKSPSSTTTTPPPPIEVTICESQQHVIIRISDQGGGIPRDVLPYLWSFTKGPASAQILENLCKVPKLAATIHELQVDDSTTTTTTSSSGSSSLSSSRGLPATLALGASEGPLDPPSSSSSSNSSLDSSSSSNSSLATLASRPPNLRLGMGLPLSRVYAEYWAGSLALHSLEGYGVDAFLQISKLGNKNEQLTTRAMVDAV
jgi:pyruvate dehydrogenase kinase 2/3/4